MRRRRLILVLVLGTAIAVCGGPRRSCRSSAGGHLEPHSRAVQDHPGSGRLRAPRRLDPGRSRRLQGTRPRTGAEGAGPAVPDHNAERPSAGHGPERPSSSTARGRGTPPLAPFPSAPRPGSRRSIATASMSFENRQHLGSKTSPSATTSTAAKGEQSDLVERRRRHRAHRAQRLLGQLPDRHLELLEHCGRRARPLLRRQLPGGRLRHLLQQLHQRLLQALLRQQHGRFRLLHRRLPAGLRPSHGVRPGREQARSASPAPTPAATCWSNTTQCDNNKSGLVSNSQNNDDWPSPQIGLCPAGQSGPLGTQSCTVWADNYVHDNNNPNVPGNGSGLAGGSPVGSGMILAGSTYVTLSGNTVSHNGAWGELDRRPARPGVPARRRSEPVPGRHIRAGARRRNLLLPRLRQRERRQLVLGQRVLRQSEQWRYRPLDVTEDLDGLRFNTAISALMVFVNEAMTWEVKPVAALRTFLVLLQPFAPHLAEELWSKINPPGAGNSLSYQPWPKYDPALLVEDTLEIPVQVNGKLRDVIKVPAGATKEQLEAAGAGQREGKTLY